MALSITLGFCLLVYLAVPYVATPKFIVKNDTNFSIQITAHWRDKNKSLGQLSPGSELEFEVNDEAAMKFKVEFPEGRVLSSSPAVYFTSGTITRAIITGASIEVSTQL